MGNGRDLVTGMGGGGGVMRMLMGQLEGCREEGTRRIRVIKSKEWRNSFFKKLNSIFSPG